MLAGVTVCGSACRNVSADLLGVLVGGTGALVEDERQWIGAARQWVPMVVAVVVAIVRPGTYHVLARQEHYMTTVKAQEAYGSFIGIRPCWGGVTCVSFAVKGETRELSISGSGVKCETMHLSDRINRALGENKRLLAVWPGRR